MMADNLDAPGHPEESTIHDIQAPSDDNQETPTLNEAEAEESHTQGETQETEDTRDEQPGTSQGSPDAWQAEAATWQKRQADAMRWAQQEKARADKADHTLESLKEAGYDPSDLLDLTDTNQQMDLDQRYVPREQFQQTVARFEWETAKRDYTAQNTQFKSPEMNQLLDYFATQQLNAEYQQYGSFQSRPTDLLPKAANMASSFAQKLKEQGGKEATQKRQKIKTTGVTEGSTAKKETPEETIPNARADYVRLHEERLRKIRGEVD